MKSLQAYFEVRREGIYFAFTYELSVQVNKSQVVDTKKTEEKPSVLVALLVSKVKVKSQESVKDECK